jgi:hypothetical protein
MKYWKYFYTIIGGVTGSFLSFIIFRYLAQIRKADFSQVNFVIIPVVFVATDLTVYAVRSWRWTKQDPKKRDWCISSVAHGCVGAIWGLTFGYFTQIDLVWSITAFAIIYAIPYLGIISAFVSLPLFWMTCWNKYTVEYNHWTWSGWKTERVWTIPSSMEWVRTPFFVHLIVIPFFALLGFKMAGIIPSIIEDWKKNREKWVGAIVGGLICLIWSTLPFSLAFLGQFKLLTTLLKVFMVVNFLIIPFCIYGTSLVSHTEWMDLLEYGSPGGSLARAIQYSVINICGGALIGLYISGIANLDASYIPWLMMVCAVIGALPYVGALFIFGGVLLQIYFVITQWQKILEFTPSSIETPFPMLSLLIISLPPLLAIPCSTYLGYETAGFIWIKLQKVRIKLIEGRIKNLRNIVEKHKVVLAEKMEIEQNISKIVGLNPKNFGLKVTLYRERAHTIINDQIQTRIIEIEEDLQKVIQARKQVEDKLRVLYNEKDILEQRLKDVNNKLRILEKVIDPANIKIKMQKLESEWKGIRKQELERITPVGELETLYKEGLLLNFLIEEKVQEIENMRKELAHLTLNEDTLQLERLVFEVEKLDRKIKAEEPRFFEIKDKLSRLEAKRDKIKQFLSKNENI